MRLAIISDVHSNLEALQAVVRRLEEESPDEILFLGDAVGYGPEPNECLEIIRGACRLVLMGNHDAAAVGLTDVSPFNDYAARAVAYTRDVLAPSAAAYLASLPYEGDRHGLRLVHASPDDPPAWHYIVNGAAAARAFGHFGEPVCFIGHSHYPIAYFTDREGDLGALSPERLVLEEGRRYIYNVGSVGQPRDRDPRAAAAVYDTGTGEIRLMRVPYDIAAVQAKMTARGLPPYLVRRLSIGA